MNLDTFRIFRYSRTHTQPNSTPTIYIIDSKTIKKATKNAKKIARKRFSNHMCVHSLLKKWPQNKIKELMFRMNLKLNSVGSRCYHQFLLEHTMFRRVK